MKTKFGNYLEKFMKEKSYTLDFISSQTEASLSVVGHYRKGIRIPKDDFLEKFIEKFIKNDKEKEYLRYIVAYDRSPDLIKRKLDEVEDKTTAEIVSLPLIGKAAAGTGYINFEENSQMEVVSSIPKSGLSKNSFLVEVSGDSMFPTLSDGDLVIIDPKTNDKDYLQGKVCVLTYHDQTYVKRVKFEKNRIKLISDNIDKKLYKDIIIEEDELEYVICHGVVIESRRKH
nr:S24 family peptidase [uncultured Cetobacterium sp.]